MTYEVRVSPRGQQLVLEVISQQRGRRVGQPIDRLLATLNRSASPSLVLFGRRLVRLGQRFEMLPGLVGPARRRVTLKIVPPGLPGGIDEMQALEGKSAIEVRLRRRV